MEIVFISLIVIVVLVVLLILWKFHCVITTCFFKHSYIKILSEIFVLLLTILSIFYSIHANIFADKSTSDNFLTYPINQIERNNKDYCQPVKYNNNTINKDNVNFIFIIDRTLSGVDTTNNSLKNKLIDSINDSTLSRNKKYIQISDILLYKTMMSLKQKDIDSSNCHIIIYNGIKQKLKESNENIEIIQTCIEPEIFLKKYINFINNKNNKETNTDISKLFQLAHSDKKINVLTIISDFEHEKETADIIKLGHEIDKFGTTYSDSTVLNLVCLSGNLKNNLNSIKETKEIIEKYTHFIYLYEYEEGQLTNESERELPSFITQVPKKDTIQKIILYYPLPFGKYFKTKNSRITFSKITGDNKFWINIKSESNPQESSFLKVMELGKKEIQLIDNPKLVEIDNNKKFSLILESQGNPDNLFFEISRPSDLTRQRIPIEVKEYLTDEACHILVIFNSLLIILLIFLTWFFYYKCNIHCYLIKKRKALKIGSETIIILPVLSSSFFLVYMLKIYWTLHRINSLSLFFIWLVIVSIFIYFLIHFFRFERKNLNKKCNELHKK